MPNVMSSIRMDGRSERVEHDYGCAAAPRTRIDRARSVDKLAGTAQWRKAKSDC